MTKIEVGKCYETPDLHQIVRVDTIRDDLVWVGLAGPGIHHMGLFSIPLEEMQLYYHEIPCQNPSIN